ncbi:amidohydrolase [Paenibacillus sp. IB182496]|uniref:Amidohydrolase n=1 Tax=Paenibacillus sabuli TaxID=2772509 RepID=A0A927GPU6_9BACL|nr:amidohydrolase family protein [Paenibacillus sabuli]MBD2843693.1 amidohydrolase [Paenibacillus sabuli]
MIFDCHTHLFGPGMISGAADAAIRRAWGEDMRIEATPEQHAASLKPYRGAIVLAFAAHATGMVVPNAYVADYCRSDPDRLFGFASVDPSDWDCVAQFETAVRELGLRGLKLGPIYQNFHPEDKRHFALYAKAQELGVPVLWHQGTSFVPEGYLEASRPAALDPIARAFPELKMIIAHMGHPWIDECIALVRKHPNLYMDVSALGSRPWQFYNALVSAVEYGAQDKLLFGSDYPFFTTERMAEAVQGINAPAEGTRLPRVPERVIEQLLHRPTPELLGLV